MRLLTLVCENFRNYKELRAEWAPALNILLGANAQGKSNLLEAVYVLATGRSFRTHRERELVRWGADAAMAAGEAESGGLQTKIEIRWSERGKETFVGGVPVERRTDLLGVLQAVAFTPDHLQLVKGGPAERRRFLDECLVQISPGYRHEFSRYQRVLRQRNKVLEAVAQRTIPLEALDAWTPQLVESGASLVARRAQAVEALSELAGQAHAGITEGRERLQILYRPFLAEDEAGGASYWGDAQAVKERFQEMLAEGRRDELRRGQTLTGPQRDDLQFLIDGSDARAFGSQGQQRSAVLSLKLAEISFMENQTGSRPILLLDDVLSELDAGRRRLFVDAAAGRTQTFLTTASPEYLQGGWLQKEPFGEMKWFQIEAGSLTQRGPAL